MSERKIVAGVTLMQDFCRPGSEAFGGYIDYLDREEAQRNNAIQTFNLFNDYMGNPEKSSGLFTADKDALTLDEKRELKDIFQIAQDNGSLMWQTVISFDNAWLEKNGVYDAERQMLDERKIKEVARMAINKLLKEEKLEHAVWSAGIHYNTDNLHIHIATVEPFPMREKMMYDGNLEVRGKFKLGNINKCKSVVVNELMQTKDVNLQINKIIRKDIVEQLKARELTQDPILKEKFLALCEKLPELPGNLMHYNNRAMAPYRGYIDEISKLFLEKYTPEQYKELTEILERQSRLYEEAYGGENYGYYKEDKLYDLMQRMGNATLRAAKEYLKSLGQKTEELEQKSGRTGTTAQMYLPENESQVDIPDIMPEQPAGDFMDKNTKQQKKADMNVEWDVRIKPGSHKQESQMSEENLNDDFKAAEEYFALLQEKRLETDTREIGNKDYGKYFSQFKKIKKELKDYLSPPQKDIKQEEFLKKVEMVSETNPFVKYLLAEMHYYGQLTEVDGEKAQQYFSEVLDILKWDLEAGYLDRGEDGKFDFQSYVGYRIGKMYDRGWGTSEDKSVAAEYYKRSDTQYARYALGCLYYSGEGVEQDYEKAFDLFHSIQGNAFADLKCAELYEHGKGVETDLDASQKYYKKAFDELMRLEEKEADALYEYQLGRLLYQGKGCEQDTEQAVGYLQKAAQEKNVPAILLLSNIYLGQGKADQLQGLISELEKLAKNDKNVNAQYTLGKIYTSDWEMQDLEKGILYLEQATKQGNEFAKYRSGKIYLDDTSPAYDPQKGIKYMEELADSGNEYAQAKMGFEYIKGEHVFKNYSLAREYFSKAAEQGNQYAEAMLKDISTSPANAGARRKYDPLGELDRAMIALRRSFYEAQQETMKNLILYERMLEEEAELQSI